MPPEDTLRMPAPDLASLLGRARDEDEPVFPLVRRRAPSLEPLLDPEIPVSSSSVSMLLVVALLAATALLLVWALR